MRTYPQFKLRIPPDLKQWLETGASTNRRSISGQIIHLLEATKKASDQPASNPDASTTTV